MFDPWLALSVGVGVIAAVGLHFLTHRRKLWPGAKPRDHRLAQRVAMVVGCSVEEANPAVRRELDIAPNQSDETLVKRAVYHYRQDLPEAPWPVYRDTAPG